MNLTNKQQAFVEEYVKDFNATQAAIRAGYSEKTARSMGHQNLTKLDIAEEIQTRINERAMSANEVLVRLAEQARGEYCRYVNENGSIEIDKLVKDGKAHLIKSIKQTRYGLSIEFYDAQAALSLIGKHHALFTDRVRVDDWQGDVISMLKRGEINPEEVKAVWPDLATEFFVKAGIDAG